ncbi:hypothetical protein B8037_26810, partial [Klebsiella pneumoniae]
PRQPDHLKELSLIRKILIRMKSWENYIYLDHLTGGGAGGAPPPPPRGQASLSTRPSIITCRTPCEQGSIRPRTP